MLQGLRNQRLAQIDASVAATHVGRGAASSRPGLRSEYVGVMKIIDGSCYDESDTELSNVAITKMVAKE
jgi:hypothetical protein